MSFGDPLAEIKQGSGRSMQKSIFKRYLGITMVIIVLSFIVLGSVMMVFFGSYWRGEKRELLTQNAKSISEVASRFLTKKDEENYTLETEVLKSFVKTFSHSADADIFITDLSGAILLGNYANSKLETLEKTPPKAVQIAARGLYEGVGDLGGVYPEKFYIIGVPMNTEENECVGAVFAATSAATVNAFQREALHIFLLASLTAFLSAFCVVGIFAFRLVNPLRQMSAAARSFGAGNFSVRVPVTSSDEIGQLAQSFNNMADSLSNSEGMRRSFIANVSHELKTPMTTIAGFIDGILDGTIPQADREKYLQIVSNEVKRLSRLVKSMLDLSRIDSGEMKLHPTSFDLTGTIFNTLLTFEQSIEEKELEIEGLEAVGPLMIYADQDLIHQVIYNLVENAVKFTNPKGTIHFQISDGIDRTSVAIENTGADISPEELPMIFDRFYKTDKSRSQDKNGMGLGLYLVRTIIKLHKGNIWATSVVNEYCRFEFFLPKPQETPKLKENGARLKEGRGKEREKTKERPSLEGEEKRNEP